MLFRKGEPTEKTSQKWAYKDGVVYAVRFDEDDRVKSVVGISADQELPDVGPVNAYMGYDDLTSRLGEPSAVATSKDGLRRLISYANRGIVIGMEKDEIELLGVFTGDPMTFDGLQEAPAP